MWLIVLSIVILLIIIYICARWQTDTFEDYMYGFWIADDEFCEESEIDSMMVFIGAPEHSMGKLGSTSRTCYIVIMDAMSNQGFKLVYTPSCKAMISGNYVIEATPTFDDEQIWPEKVTIKVNILRGTMQIMTSDGLMWARLEKQHDITNLAAVQEGADVVVKS